MTAAPAGEHRWSPPSHPDPPEDQPLGVDAPASSTPVDGYPAVHVRVRFTKTPGEQRCPGFVERDAGTIVYVQLVHMGFVHHVWIPREHVTRRLLRPRGGTAGS